MIVMQFHDMKEIDLKLMLLSGSEIELGNLKIVPYTLREVKNYGYTNYMKNLQWISLSIDDFIGSVLDENKRKILEINRESLKAFDFYIKLGGKEMQDKLVEVLKMIFRNDDLRVLDNGIIAIDFVKLGIIIEDDDGNVVEIKDDKLSELDDDKIKIINRDNFDDIVKIVRLQNYLEQPEEAVEEEEPADEEARKLLEYMKEIRKKVEEKKRQQSEDGEEANIDIASIVSAVSSKSNSVNKLNIWDFTIYQIYDEYARLELIDNYDFSIRAMMAGAKEVDLKHWSSKL